MELGQEFVDLCKSDKLRKATLGNFYDWTAVSSTGVIWYIDPLLRHGSNILRTSERICTKCGLSCSDASRLAQHRRPELFARREIHESGQPKASRGLARPSCEGEHAGGSTDTSTKIVVSDSHDIIESESPLELGPTPIPQLAYRAEGSTCMALHQHQPRDPSCPYRCKLVLLFSVIDRLSHGDDSSRVDEES